MKLWKPALLALIAALVILIFLITPTLRFTDISESNDITLILIDGKEFTAELANSTIERKRGLMFREKLPENHGMLLVFENEGVYSMWMMNMKFSLDILWINSQGMIIHIEKEVQPCSYNCATYQSRSPAKYVLEINSGLVDEMGIQKGTFIEIALDKE